MRKGLVSLLIGAGLVALSGAAPAAPHHGLDIDLGVRAPGYVRAPVAHHSAPAVHMPPPALHQSRWAHNEPRPHYLADHDAPRHPARYVQHADHHR